MYNEYDKKSQKKKNSATPLLHNPQAVGPYKVELVFTKICTLGAELYRTDRQACKS